MKMPYLEVEWRTLIKDARSMQSLTFRLAPLEWVGWLNNVSFWRIAVKDECQGTADFRRILTWAMLRVQGRFEGSF